MKSCLHLLLPALLVCAPIASAQNAGGLGDGVDHDRLAGATFPAFVNLFTGGPGDGYDGAWASPFAAAVTVDAGWNLIGLPVEVADPSVAVLFPNAVVGSLFSFAGGYVPQKDMQTCTGYWLRFPAPETVTLPGAPLNQCTIALTSGWNMIAGPGCVVALADVVDLGKVILPGTLFGFSGGYLPATTIEPGEGYWIRARGAGTITLDCQTTSGPTAGMQP